MQDEPEDLRRAVEVLNLTVNMIAEGFNAYTLALSEMYKTIEQLNKRIEDLEGD